jgi:hypothetical protein
MSLPIIEGNVSIADFFYEDYCPWVWYGDSVSVSLAPPFLKAFKPNHLSGIGSSTAQAFLSALGSFVPGDGGVTKTDYAENGGAASNTGLHYSNIGVPEVALTAGVTHNTPGHSFDQRILEVTFSDENAWKAKMPFPVLSKQAGTWRVIYLQHANSPTSFRVWDTQPRTDWLTAGAVTKNETVNFRGDGTTKVTYQDFAVPAVTTNYDATKGRRLGFFAPTGAYPTNDKLNVKEAEFVVDRTGNIPHFAAVGGWSLDSMLNTSFHYNDLNMKNYLQAIDCKLAMIMIGTNGFNSAGYTRPEFGPKLRQYMNKCKEANSEMRFILVGYPYFYNSGSASLGLAYYQDINNAMRDAMQDDTLFVNLGEIMGEPDLVNAMTADGIHPSHEGTTPTGYGAYEIARGLVAGLQYARAKVAAPSNLKKVNASVSGLKPNTTYLVEKVSPGVVKGEVPIFSAITDASGMLNEITVAKHAKYAIRERNRPATRVIETGSSGRLAV